MSLRQLAACAYVAKSSLSERIEDLRVALVGYRDRDGSQRIERVDIIDAWAAVRTLTCSPRM
jgi:hypothetical protein